MAIFLVMPEVLWCLTRCGNMGGTVWAVDAVEWAEVQGSYFVLQGFNLTGACGGLAWARMFWPTLPILSHHKHLCQNSNCTEVSCEEKHTVWPQEKAWATPMWVCTLWQIAPLLLLAPSHMACSNTQCREATILHRHKTLYNNFCYWVPGQWVLLSRQGIGLSILEAQLK